MDNLIPKCIDNYLAISHCFQSTYGQHYPKELALFIIKLYYHLFRIKIKCGFNHTLMMFENELYVWGDNDYNRLGFESYSITKSPQKIQLWSESHISSSNATPQEIDLSNIKKFVCGFCYSVAITYSNEIYACGNNNCSHLRLEPDNYAKFQQEIGFRNIKKIIFKKPQIIIITHCNEVYTWISDHYSYPKSCMMGLGDILHRDWRDEHSVKKIDLPNIKKIVCGDDHIISLTHSNEIYGWGYNNYGQLGLKDITQINLPHKLDLSNIKDIICGFRHSIAITHSNEIYVWGWNEHGQLGLGHNTNIYSPQKLDLLHIKKIICGYAHTIAMTYSNEIYVWGYNKNGQLGLGHNMDMNLPQKLDLPNVKKIVCGLDHTVALTYSNEIYVWGSNESGELGLGHYDNMNSPQKLIIKLT
jgi:alpha-tubulin suppressor-like RCC1 family protein